MNGPYFQQGLASEVPGTATNTYLLAEAGTWADYGGKFLLARELERQRCAQMPAARGQAQLLRRQRKLVPGEQTAVVRAMVAEFPGWQLSRHIKHKCVRWHKNKPQEVEVLARKQNFST